MYYNLLCTSIFLFSSSTGLLLPLNCVFAGAELWPLAWELSQATLTLVTLFIKGMFAGAVCQSQSYVSLQPLHVIGEGNFSAEPSAYDTIRGMFVCIKFYNLWSKVNVSGVKNLCVNSTGMGTKTHTQVYSFLSVFSVYCNTVIQGE